MRKILTAQIRDLRFANKSRTLPRGNRKNAKRGPEGQKNYYTSICASSRRAKPDEKKQNKLERGLTAKKAYEMVLQSWIIDYLKVYQISGKVIKFI